MATIDYHLKNSSSLSDKETHLENPKKTPLETYDYRDQNGKLQFQVYRIGPKKFKQRKPDGKGGWISNIKEVKRILYRLPELIAAPAEAVVYVVEGEKDVNTLANNGFVSTCNPMGAKCWRKEYNEWFKGANVVIVADKDLDGRIHSQRVAKNIHGIANSIRIVELPGEGVKDATDWFDQGGNADGFEEICKKADLFTGDGCPTRNDDRNSTETAFSFQLTPSHLSVSSASLVSSVSSVSSVGLESTSKENEQIQVRADSSANYSSGSKVETIESAVEASLPSAPKRNNRSLLLLNRYLIGIEQDTGKKLSPAEKNRAFALWYEATEKLGFLNPEETREQYWSGFTARYSKAKKPATHRFNLEELLQESDARPDPPEAVDIPNKKVVRLYKLCIRLQEIHGKDPFFLSSRDAAKLLEYKSPSDGNDALNALVGLGYLKLVQKGGLNIPGVNVRVKTSHLCSGQNPPL